MSLTNPALRADNVAFSSKNISSAASVYQYTSSANERVIFLVRLTNAAGNGDYIIYLKRTRSAVVTIALPKLTATAASGETGIEFNAIEVYCKNGDTIDIMIDGLALDTAVNGTVDIVALNFSLLETSDTMAEGTTLTRLSGMLVQDGAVYQYTANALELAPSNSATVAITAADADALAAGQYVIRPYYTFAERVTSTSGDNLATSRVIFAIKADPDDADDDALVLADNVTGLLRINGVAATPADGSVAVSGSTGDWAIDLRVESSATADLDAIIEGEYPAAIKYQTSGGADDLPLDDGVASIITGRIKAI